MKKIFIIIGVLVIAISIIKSNIQKPKNLSENTKESLSELADLNTNLADDLSTGDVLNEDKYVLKKSIENSDKSLNSSDKNFSIALPLMQDFKKKDLKAAAEYSKFVNSSNIEQALSNETLTNSNKINFFISKIDELKNAYDKYLFIYDQNVAEIKRKMRNSEITKEFISGFEGSLKQSRERMERLKNYSFTYYSRLKDILKLADTINSKDLFMIDGDSLVILDDNYVNKYNVAIEKFNKALVIMEKEQEAYVQNMRNSSNKLKNYIEKN
jgi:hypothetical protein